MFEDFQKFGAETTILTLHFEINVSSKIYTEKSVTFTFMNFLAV